MPPKVKTTKEDIVNAAVQIVRQSGESALNARTIAAALGCSTQPIFSNFASMEELRLAVIAKADALCQAYVQREIESAIFPAYKASGRAYIRFAKEEKELFQLLYMRDRSAEPQTIDSELNDKMVSLVRQNTGLENEGAKLFHLEMWAYVHGIAAMFATGFLDLEEDLISNMLTDVYQGLRKQHKME